MAVLILRQRGPNHLPDEVAAAVEQHPNLRVLDRSAKMLRIEGDCQELQAIADLYPGLDVSKERSYSQIKPFRPLAQTPRDRSS